MTLATLAEVLFPAWHNGYAVAGLVCLGWEDARAYTHAAQAANAPVILQAGPGCRAHTPLPVLGAMFRQLAADVDVPVVAHLDHGYTADECKEAIDSGFSSIMFDGSRQSLNDNIQQTGKIAELAHRAQISIEGEIGFVGYAEGEASARTSPDDAKLFAEATGVDAMAVSVGNVHLQQTQAAEIDIEAVKAIEAVCEIPLVIHGGSGVPEATRRTLAHTTKICKFNIGTELRMAFGAALRQSINDQPDVFDRVKLLQPVEAPITAKAQAIIENLMPAD